MDCMKSNEYFYDKAIQDYLEAARNLQKFVKTSGTLLSDAAAVIEKENHQRAMLEAGVQDVDVNN